MYEPINVGVFNVLAAGMSNCGSFSSDGPKGNFGKPGEASKNLFKKLVDISKMSLNPEEKTQKLTNIEIGKINKTKKYCDDITEELKTKFGSETDTFLDCILKIIKPFFEDGKDTILTEKIKKAQEKAIEKVKNESKKGGYLGVFLKELSEQLQLGLFGGFIMGQKEGETSKELDNEIALTTEFQVSYNKDKPQFILKQIEQFFTEKNGDILVCPEFDYLKGINTESYKRNYRLNPDAPEDFNNELKALPNIAFLPVGYYKNKFNTKDENDDFITPFTHFDGNKASMNPSANFYRVIFYNKLKYSINNLSVSGDDSDLKKLLEAESERMELLLVTKTGGSQFLLFSCHLKSTSELKDYAEVKEKEIKKINSILAKATKYKNLPIVIAGDFNFPLFESLPNHVSRHVEDVVSAYKTINGFDGKLDSETPAYEDLDDETIRNTVSIYVNQITRMKEQFIDGKKQELTDMDRDQIKEFKKAQELELQKGAIIKKWMDFMKTLCVDTDSLKSYNTTGVCLKKRFTDKQGNDQVFVGKGEKRKYNTDFIGLYHEGEEIPDYIQNNKIKDISGRTDVETTYCPYVLLKSDTKTIDLGTVTSTGSYIANSWLSDHSIVMRTIQLSTTSAAEGGGLSSNKSISSRKKSSRKKTKKKKSSRKKTKRKRSKRKSSKRSKSKKNKKKTTKK